MNWLTHIFRATKYSLEGLWAALRTEIALQQEVLVLLVLLILVPLCGLDFLTGAFVLFAWVMVMVVELVNSAIEATLNRFGNEIHPLTKRGKDIASAAVFCAVSFNVILWAVLACRIFFKVGGGAL